MTTTDHKDGALFALIETERAARERWDHAKRTEVDPRHEAGTLTPAIEREIIDRWFAPCCEAERAVIDAPAYTPEGIRAKVPYLRALVEIDADERPVLAFLADVERVIGGAA